MNLFFGDGASPPQKKNDGKLHHNIQSYIAFVYYME
jgi:hypothetical protein